MFELFVKKITFLETVSLNTQFFKLMKLNSTFFNQFHVTKRLYSNDLITHQENIQTAPYRNISLPLKL